MARIRTRPAPRSKPTLPPRPPRATKPPPAKAASKKEPAKPARAPLTASCHCGAVKLELARKPKQLTKCNCSICRRYGVAWAYTKWSSVRIVCRPGALAVYVWGSGRLAFNRCKTCGCVTHYERVIDPATGTMGVNARMLPPEVTDGLPVQHLDGMKTWKVLRTPPYDGF